ncbi:MAG: hypothetical protein ABFS12_17845 [Bacteroidota bacterium]
MNHVGFNITEKKLQLVEVVKSSDTYYLENVDEENFSDDLNFQSNSFINILQTAFNTLNERSPLKSRLTSISLPIELFRIFSFPYEKELSEGELKEHIELEFSIVFPTFSFQDYLVRPKIISKGIYSYSEILVIAIEKKLLQILHDFLSTNNLSLHFIDNVHFSSDLLLGKKSTVNLYKGSDFISCSIYINNDLIGFRKFNASSTTKLIEYLRELNLRDDLGLNDFNISGDTDFYSLKQEIEDSLQLELNTIDPFNRIKASELFTQTDQFINNPSLFSSAAGICFRVS